MGTNKATQKFLRHVRKHLMCSKETRRQAYCRAKKLLSDFAEENPDASYADFITAFGEPDEFAQQTLLTIDPAEIQITRKKQMYVKAALISIGALVVISTFGYFASRYIHMQEVVRGDFYVVEEEAIILSRQEEVQRS